MSWGFCCPQRIHDYMHQQFWGIVAQGEERLLKFSFMHLKVTHLTQLTSVWHHQIYFSLADETDLSLEFSLYFGTCVYFISFIIILMPLTNVVPGAENQWEAVLYLLPFSMKWSGHIWARWWREGGTHCYASILNVNITKLALAMFASATNWHNLSISLSSPLCLVLVSKF